MGETNGETVTMELEESIWNLKTVDPIVNEKYSKLRVSDAEIIGEKGMEKMRIVMEAEINES